MIPAISAAAARGKDGKLYLALVNVDPDQPASITAGLAGARVSGTVLTGEAMDAMNGFGVPAAVVPRPFADARLSGGTLQATLPAKSVVMLTIE